MSAPIKLLTKTQQHTLAQVANNRPGRSPRSLAALRERGMLDKSDKLTPDGKVTAHFLLEDQAEEFWARHRGQPRASHLARYLLRVRESPGARTVGDGTGVGYTTLYPDLFRTLVDADMWVTRELSPLGEMVLEVIEADPEGLLMVQVPVLVN